MADGLDGKSVDMSTIPDNPHFIDHPATLLDPSRRLEWVTVLNSDKKLIYGYVFRREDYPWLQHWGNYPSVPGVQCGQCNQHSEEHGTSSGRGAAGPMQRLSTLDSEQLGAVCARCHPSWEETTAKGPHSVLNVRVQLYRLTNSRCYDSDDRRISCTACHNPHEALVTDVSHYDAKCRQCHGESANNGMRTAKKCRVSGTERVKCHMPKIEIPTLHYSFTDHQIRIQRADGRYPE